MRRLVIPSMLVRFSVLSILLMTLLVVVVGSVLRGQIQHRALKDAEERARSIAITGVEPHLDDARLSGMDDAELNAFARAIRADAVSATGVDRVKVFNDEPRIVFSDDRDQIGRSAATSDLVRDALANRIGSKLTTGTDHSGRGRRMLEVFVPLRRQKSGHAAGVLEVYLPYAPVEAVINADTRKLFTVLIGGLIVLWLGLFQIVASASGALRRHARREHHQARHDGLTGLGNRRTLHERAGAVLADPLGGTSALLLIDLDHFKEINDTLGHDQGDVLLRRVGERLAEATRDSDVLARLGGDEFAIFLAGIPSADTAVRRAHDIRDALTPPIQLDTLSVRIDASVGIALHPDDGATVDDLLKHADVAMYVAKETPGRVCRYAADIDPYSRERLSLATELRDAIDRDELVVHYQPIVDAGNRSVHAVEALVRWQHPERGLLPPGDFLPLATRTGAIGPLTSFVIQQAVQDAFRWQEEGRDIAVACNLASASAADAALPDLVAAALERWKLRPDRLVLELSEDTVINDPQRVGQVLARLHALGVRLALDDFGTGQSSLALLRTLPLDQLKIDRTFIMNSLAESEDRAVVQAILALAQSLGLETVAEGVEDEPTADALTARGCDRLQGFLFSRPVSVVDLDLLLAAADDARAATAPR